MIGSIAAFRHLAVQFPQVLRVALVFVQAMHETNKLTPQNIEEIIEQEDQFRQLGKGGLSIHQLLVVVRWLVYQYANNPHELAKWAAQIEQELTSRSA